MRSPVEVLAGAAGPLQALYGAACQGVPPATVALVHLRVSQINGCGQCIDGGAKHALKDGETAERLFALSAWREAPYFTAAERAALDLAEAATRIADSPEGVPDAVWDEASRHYDESGMAGLVLVIAVVNLFNRINVPTRQVSGEQKW
ncbi:MAG TPA: carboxymuconolactone decarboxylase family protein [Opitutaceae bacterium]|nr:carboxymuconolactone decarboxylase family protein [Opitutaceae bacterium]